MHTLYGAQMGARKSYNPKHKGKKSYQPILTFLAETREYVAGELRNGDRPTGKQIARHLHSALQSLPAGVERIFARADAGFYCWEAVEAYQQAGCRFIVVARKVRNSRRQRCSTLGFTCRLADGNPQLQPLDGGQVGLLREQPT